MLRSTTKDMYNYAWRYGMLKFTEIKMICEQYKIYIYKDREGQGRPLPVANRVVTPLEGVVDPVTHL